MTQAKGTSHLLDLTRLISRVGSGVFTGVDRVELAYLKAILDHPKNCWFLVKTAKGYLFLDRSGGEVLFTKITGQTDWGKAGFLSLFSRALHPLRRRAEADIRKLAIDRALPHRLSAMLLRQKLENFTYLNIGHSNVIPRTLQAVRDQKGSKIAVFIHDTIPLDHQAFQTAASTLRFEKLMRSVQEYADVVIYNSTHSMADSERVFGNGRCPTCVVAHLGVETMPIQPELLPKGPDYSRPYFLILGTIEPRKNHRLLLDIWRGFATKFNPKDVPQLIITGNRGWENEIFFNILDNDLMIDKTVFEFNGLPDGAIGALTKGARAALFPSFAEGYGLPPAEAAKLGTPVICSDLAVHREVLGDYPVYLDPHDAYSWEKEIIQRSVEAKSGRGMKANTQSKAVLSTWQGHFETVFAVL